MPKEIIKQLQSEEKKVALDKEFIHLSKEVKRLAGTPVHHPEVQQLMDTMLKSTLTFLGEEATHSLGTLEHTEIEELDSLLPSPYTEEEEKWLHEAIEYYTIQNGMYDPNWN